MNISTKLCLNHTPDRLDATNLLLQTQQRGNSNEVISAGVNTQPVKSVKRPDGPEKSGSIKRLIKILCCHKAVSSPGTLGVGGGHLSCLSNG